LESVEKKIKSFLQQLRSCCRKNFISSPRSFYTYRSL
jgi:hypothetical protein